jgi:hypothetical protein
VPLLKENIRHIVGAVFASCWFVAVLPIAEAKPFTSMTRLESLMSKCRLSELTELRTSSHSPQSLEAVAMLSIRFNLA